MATPNVFNILKSNAVLYYAPVGEAEPDETSVAAGAAWGGNWERVGATKEPLTCLYEDEHTEVNIEESLSAVHRFRTSESLTLETVLAELEADYLQLLLEGTVTDTAAGAGQVGFEELPAGGVALRTSYAWGFEGVYQDSGGNNHAARVFIYRATARLNGELMFSKREDDYLGVPIQVQALSHATNLGDLFKFQRVTAVATS